MSPHIRVSWTVSLFLALSLSLDSMLLKAGFWSLWASFDPLNGCDFPGCFIRCEFDGHLSFPLGGIEVPAGDGVSNSFC